MPCHSASLSVLCVIPFLLCPFISLCLCDSVAIPSSPPFSSPTPPASAANLLVAVSKTPDPPVISRRSGTSRNNSSHSKHIYSAEFCSHTSGKPPCTSHAPPSPAEM